MAKGDSNANSVNTDANGTAGESGESGQLKSIGDIARRVEERAGGVDGSQGTTIRDPEKDAGAAPETKRRGRPPGAKNRAKEGATEGAPQERPASKAAQARSVALDAKVLAPQIQGLHFMFATLSGQPLFIVNENEAVMMAQAIVEVASHYDVEFNSPAMSWAKLIAVLGMIYGPKIMAIRLVLIQQRTKRETGEKVGFEHMPQTSNPIDYNAAAQ